MRKIISTILLISLLCSCERVLRPGSEGSGDIVIELSSALQTKADEARDGSKMNNLHIWLVSGSNIVDYLNWEVAYTDETTSYCQISAEDGGATAKALFTGVDKGQYTLYFVANLPSNLKISAYKKGGTIDANFTHHILPSVVNNEPPFDDEAGMPLSLVKSIEVSAGTNRISAELVRTCARIRLTVRNNTVENTLVLKKIALSADGNPSLGYLFPRADFSKPVKAAMGPFNSMELTKEGQTTNIVIPHGDTYTYIDQYMYETGPNGAVSLGFEIAGGLFKDGVTSATMAQVPTGSSETRNSYSKDDNPLTSEVKPLNKTYLIKSRSGGFLYDDGSGTPKVTTSTDAKTLISEPNPDRYLWEFSKETGSTNIKNYGTKKFLVIGTSGSVKMDLSSTEDMAYRGSDYNTGGTGFRFYNGTITGKNYYRNCTSYTLSATSSTVSVKQITNWGKDSKLSYSSDPSCYFNLIGVTITTITEPIYELNLQGNYGSAAEKYFDKTVSSLHYIGKYGNPIPLEHIYRNQDVQIVVNVHYNPDSGVLYFETSDWEDESNDTTFD